MGMIADCFARTMAFVTQRSTPSYATPAGSPADGKMAATNADTSVANVREHVAYGPARTLPPDSGAAGSRPSPDGRTKGSAPSPGTFGSFRAPNEGTTNVHATTAKPMRYGLQSDDGHAARPGASIAIKPAPFDGKQEGQK